MKEVGLEDIKDKLEMPQRVTIISHTNPDGDAIGSSLGLKSILQNGGHHVTVIFPTDYPPILKFLEGIEESLISVVQTDEAERAINTADILFFLDLSIRSATAVGSAVSTIRLVRPKTDWTGSSHIDKTKHKTCHPRDGR